MHPLFRARHIALSVALTLLLGAGGFTLVGIAAADAAGPASALDPLAVEDPFVIPAFHEGDAGLLVESGGVEARSIAFAIGNGTTMYDQDGVERVATPVLLNETVGAWSREDRWFMASPFSDWLGRSMVHTIEEVQDDERAWVQWETFGYDDAPFLHCAFVPPFTSAELDGRRHADDRRCLFGAHGPHATWQVAAIGEQEGVRVMELHLWMHDQPGEPEMRVWYREDIPVPIRMENADLEYMSQAGVSWTLERFDRGATPIHTGATGKVLPPVHTAPATTTLLDETGLEHDFPLSAAYEQARLRDADMQPFLEAHPGARMVCARFASFDLAEPEGTVQRWTFWLADASATFGTAISKRPLETGLPVPMDRYAREDPGGCPYTPGEDDSVRLPATYPATAPRVADIEANVRQIMADELAEVPFAWEFQVMEDGTLIINAGQTHYSTESEDLVPLVPFLTGDRNEHNAWDTVYVTWVDGVRTGHGSTRSTYEYGSYAQRSSTAVAHDGEEEVAPVSASWRVPLQPTAAIGAGAGLIGLLYWLSPLARSPLALFSRVRADRALEHPMRAEIHQIVSDHPGIHFQQLVRRTGKSRGTVGHHVDILLQKGLIATGTAAGFRCFYVPGQTDRRVAATAAVLKAPAARQIMARLHHEQRVTDLAAAIGISKAAVSRHVTRLEGAGLIERRRQGRDHWLRAVDPRA